MCMYYPCKPLLTKGKLDRKQTIKTDKGRKKNRDLSHPWLLQLCFAAGHRGKKVCVQRAKALKAQVYPSFFKMLLNKPISLWNLGRENKAQKYEPRQDVLFHVHLHAVPASPVDCPKVIWQTVGSFLHRVNFWSNSTCISDGLKICIHCHCFCSVQWCLPMSWVYDVCSKCFSVDIFCNLSEDKLH